jgi:hypothetical protein
MILLSDFVSVDTLDVKLLFPVTTATINNNLTVVSNVSKVSNVKEKVSFDPILSGATTPSETDLVIRSLRR